MSATDEKRTSAMDEGPTAQGARPWVGIAAILAAAFLIRVIGADYALWYDEVASLAFARVPLHTLWSEWILPETNPPLYYSLLHIWIGVFGDSDFAIRFLSVIIGTVGVWLTYLLAKSLGGRRVGLIAASLIAVSGEHVLFSQQARGYILGATAATAALLGVVLFCKAWDSTGTHRTYWKSLAIYISGCVVALYCHTMLVALPVLVNGFVIARMLMRRPLDRRLMADWVIANGIVGAAWAWWIMITLKQLAAPHSIAWIARPSPLKAMLITFESYVSPGNIGLEWAVGLLALIPFALMVRKYFKGPELILPLSAIGAPVLLYLVSLKIPVLMPRTIFWASPAFTVTVAAGLAAAKPVRRRYAAVAVAMAASVVGLASWEHRREIEPWGKVVSTLVAHDPHAIVVADGKGVAWELQRYCRSPVCALRIYTAPPPRTETWSAAFAAPNMITADKVESLFKANGTLFTVSRLDDSAFASVQTLGAEAESLRGHGVPYWIAITRWSAAKAGVVVTSGSNPGHQRGGLALAN